MLNCQTKIWSLSEEISCKRIKHSDLGLRIFHYGWFWMIVPLINQKMIKSPTIRVPSTLNLYILSRKALLFLEIILPATFLQELEIHDHESFSLLHHQFFQNFGNPPCNWGRGVVSSPYWPVQNWKLCVKDQPVTASHLKSLYLFVVSVEAKLYVKSQHLAQFILAILQF